MSAANEKAHAFVAGLAASAGLAPLAEAGRQAMTDLPVPTRKSERWKYSPLTPMLVTPVRTAPAHEGWPKDVPTNPIPGLDAYRIVLLNGQVVAEACDLPVADGVVCIPLLQAMAEGRIGAGDEDWSAYHTREWVGAVHAAHAQDGLFLSLESGVVLDRPVLVHHHTTGENVASCPRHRLQVGANAEAEVVLWSSAPEGASGMVNAVLEGKVGAGARLGVDKVQHEHGAVFHLAHEHVTQDKDSTFRIHTVTVQGHWVRNELNALQHGSGSHTIMHGAYLPKGQEHVDNHTTMDHTVPHCTSSELYKGILYDRSTGVFNGKVFVREDAQLTNAYQQNANIVADAGASINAKPELEIYADDVKCSHGCTVGQFDEEALFYLKSRGIADRAARALMVQAFIGEVLEGFGQDEVAQEVEGLLADRHGWM
ncbi:MAG TPA: Fe-S cluster assembly protein SufD [Flavobacteriales bacterium]|nr:Fe-S cluster assembly protein SufD [Flavobacteriales bacterium]